MMATTNLAGIYAGRFLIGIANGWFMTFSQLYIQVCFEGFGVRETLLTSTGNLASSISRNPDFSLPIVDIDR